MIENPYKNLKYHVNYRKLQYRVIDRPGCRDMLKLKNIKRNVTFYGTDKKKIHR